MTARLSGEDNHTMRALRSRSKAQAPPAWAMYEALSDPIADQTRREWLNLRECELPPQVLEAVFPTVVVWASLWPDRPDDQIRFDIQDGRLTLPFAIWPCSPVSRALPRDAGPARPH